MRIRRTLASRGLPGNFLFKWCVYVCASADHTLQETFDHLLFCSTSVFPQIFVVIICL